MLDIPYLKIIRNKIYHRFAQNTKDEDQNEDLGDGGNGKKFTKAIRQVKTTVLPPVRADFRRCT